MFSISLIPRALQNQGKHKEGNCQSDFTWKYPSHEIFPSKENVLVCQEHSEKNANKGLLVEYTERCILKQRVAKFSKNKKLFFHAVSASETLTKVIFNNNDGDCILDSTYVFQTIKVAGECFTLFLDSDCSDLVSRNSAIKIIGA